MSESKESLDSGRLPRAKRKLSLFLSKEMLYDYYSQLLDDDRKQAVEETLKGSEELKTKLQQIEAAEKYCKTLSLTRISPHYIESLRHVKPATHVLFEKFKRKNWPDYVGWTLEALTLSVLVAGLALMIPWDKIDLNFQHRFTRDEQPQKPIEVPTQENKSMELTNKEKSKETSKPTPTVAPVATTPVATTPAVATPAATVANAPATTAAPSAAAVAVNSNTKILKGLLYRAMMDLDYTPETAAEMTKMMEGYGAEKAGQVELGWRKTAPSGSYYHFIMPEKNYGPMIKTLSKYGNLRIYKSSHERVMPEGQVRIILWVADKATGESSTKSTAPADEAEAPQTTDVNQTTAPQTETTNENTTESVEQPAEPQQEQ